MKKIVLLCAAGMSASMLVQKMKQAAELENYECSIDAHAVSTARDTGADADVVLLAPQARFKLNDIKKACPGVPVECIDMQAYGKMDGKTVMQQVHRLIGD